MENQSAVLGDRYRSLDEVSDVEMVETPNPYEPSSTNADAVATSAPNQIKRPHIAYGVLAVLTCGLIGLMLAPAIATAPQVHYELRYVTTGGLVGCTGWLVLRFLFRIRG